MSTRPNDPSTDTHAGPSETPLSRFAGEDRIEPVPVHSLAAHLQRADRGDEPRLGAERYADALAGVARSLAELHERGLAHGDVRPRSLSFDPGAGRLALPPAALSRSSGGTLPAADPYIAPEQHLGEEGPSIDQYALGVVARDVFTARAAPPATAPVREVLRRATAPRPEDRYPSVAEFGEALEGAVRREAPSGLADRVAGLSARSRASLAPAAVLATVILAASLEDARSPLIGPFFTALLAPLGAATLGALAWLLVCLATTIRRPRWPSPRIAQRSWVPLVAVSAAIAGILVCGGNVAANCFWVVVGEHRTLSPNPPIHPDG